MSLEVGQLVDNKYRIIRMIGEGGMGAVFEGENVRINRRVAIKILHQHLSAEPESKARLERELRPKLRTVIKDELAAVKEEFATPRRSEITFDPGDFRLRRHAGLQLGNQLHPLHQLRHRPTLIS